MSRRFVMVLVFVAGAVSAGCAGSSDGPTDLAGDPAPETALDVAEAGPEVAVETAVETAAETAAETAVETAAETAAEAVEETIEETVEKPFPPVVAGPPAHLYDCTYDPATFPKHLSPVPLGCIVDPACTQKMITGHRGAGGDYGTIAPQNTLAAIRAGIVMGVDAVEIDVRDTKDGHFVLMHDSTVDKTTDGTGSVSDLTLEQIRALHPKLGNILAQGDFSCEKVPTLEEVLELTKDRVWIYSDTKTDKVAELVQIVKDRGMLDQYIIASGGTGKAVAARAADPSARVLVWLDGMDEVNQALKDVVPPPDVIEVQAGAAQAAVALLHPLGVKVAVDAFAQDVQFYIDSDPTPFNTLFSVGVDSVQVEFPPLILKLLGRYSY